MPSRARLRLVTLDRVVVLVPEQAGVDVLASQPRLRPVLYDASGPLPPEAGRAEVVVVAPQSDAPVVGALMARLPELRLVQTLSAGYEQWVDKLPPGASLSNGRGAHGRATAEWAVAALLSTYRGLAVFAAAQASGRWAPRATESLTGKRLLVLGAGDLATHLTSQVEPFGATTTLVGRSARAGVAGFEEVPDLIPKHDVVVLMLPLATTTHHLVDAEFLAAMPDSAILVNAGRGGLVDTDALLVELASERLRAALDVVDPEPLPSGHPLWGAPGLLLTPHIGALTHGSRHRSWLVAAEQIAAYALGQRPPNCVVDADA